MCYVLISVAGPDHFDTDPDLNPITFSFFVRNLFFLLHSTILHM
jgi:hypothetical protein